MQEYRIEATISQDGKLFIQDLPFRKGDIVKVIILNQKRKPVSEPYPLRGKPISYQKPFDSVAEEEWDALKG